MPEILITPFLTRILGQNKSRLNLTLDHDRYIMCSKIGICFEITQMCTILEGLVSSKLDFRDCQYANAQFILTLQSFSINYRFHTDFFFMKMSESKSSFRTY